MKNTINIEIPKGKIAKQESHNGSIIITFEDEKPKFFLKINAEFNYF